MTKKKKKAGKKWERKYNNKMCNDTEMSYQAPVLFIP